MTLGRPGETLGRPVNNESYYSTKDMERAWEDHWRILEYLRRLWVIPGRLGETMGDLKDSGESMWRPDDTLWRQRYALGRN